VIDLELPDPVSRTLAGFVDAARSALGGDLKSIVLYGSAAEGKLRKTSDVNVIVVLEAFDAVKIDALREPVRTAHAAIRLEPMFLLASEIRAAADAFAVKFADVLHRRRVLHGPDPFTGLVLSRSAEIARLRQVLLNLVLRLRQTYVLRSLRDEQTAVVVADAAGPLRASAAALLELEGKPAPSAREALNIMAAALPGGDGADLVKRVSEARESGSLPPEVGPRTLFGLIELARAMYERIDGVS
jgi:predicted nucleotidyltransferase